VLNGGSSQIVLPGRNNYRQPPDVSTSTPGHGDSVARECLSFQLVELILILLIAAHGQKPDQEDCPDIPGHEHFLSSVPDPSGVPNQMKREEHEAATELPTQQVNSDHVGGDSLGAAQPGMFDPGECP
jgi:hypothetical protein